MADIEIVKDYIPGALGRMAELHGSYYHQQWGFGLFFEAKIATELAEFLRRYDATKDGFWTPTLAGRIEGSMTIDGLHAEGEGSHLRWFIVSDALRGKGIGHRLIHTALDFCHRCGYQRVYLWTFEGLHAARHLYEQSGFGPRQSLEQKRTLSCSTAAMVDLIPLHPPASFGGDWLLTPCWGVMALAVP